MTDRDKFLIEAMGLIYVRTAPHGIEYRNERYPNMLYCASGWTWLGLLWDWMTGQEWRNEFLGSIGYCPHNAKQGQDLPIMSRFVNPLRFADALYNFLKERR